MSGCDKPLRHGRPVNAVVKDKGSEGVPTHSLTSDTSNASASEPSNTPAPTPEPSKSAPPASGNVDTGSSVGKYVGYAVAFIALIVGCYDVFRYFKPKENNIPAPNPKSDIPFSTYTSNSFAYKYCRRYFRSTISYTWYFAKRVITRYAWSKSGEQRDEIDSKIPVYELCNGNMKLNIYVYKPAPNQ
jgi:hypothetical protein